MKQQIILCCCLLLSANMALVELLYKNTTTLIAMMYWISAPLWLCSMTDSQPSWYPVHKSGHIVHGFPALTLIWSVVVKKTAVQSKVCVSVLSKPCLIQDPLNLVQTLPFLRVWWMINQAVWIWITSPAVWIHSGHSESPLVTHSLVILGKKNRKTKYSNSLLLHETQTKIECLRL